MEFHFLCLMAKAHNDLCVIFFFAIEVDLFQFVTKRFI